MSTTMMLPFKARIDLPFGRLRSVIEWCSSNCNEDWAFDIVEEVGKESLGSYDFRFESEKDYFTFMVWQK